MTNKGDMNMPYQSAERNGQTTDNGNCHVMNNEPPKLRASQIDAYPEARRFLESMQLEGVNTLWFLDGAFWRWERGAYRECREQEVRNQLVHFLGRRYANITKSAVNNVLECVRAGAELLGVEPTAWITGGDRPVQDLMPTLDSVVDLRAFVDGEPDFQLPSTPELFNTSALGFAFDPAAPTPTLWLETLQNWFDGDNEAIDALQEWFGYVLTPDTRQHKIMLVIGPPRSGKGTIARILGQLVGSKNLAGPSLASLGQNFGLAPLLGKPLAIVNDARLGGRSDGALVLERLLSISGEDTITVDRKHLPATTCKLPTRLMILSNELPRLTDSSGALASRMIVLPMHRSFLGSEDETLTDRLMEELSGILLWAIEGWNRLRKKRRFTQPESGRERLDALHGLASPVMVFTRECCLLDSGCSATTDQLYTAWKAWCIRNGRKESGTKQTFGRDLVAAHPHLRQRRLREGDRRPTAYEGIGLLEAG